MTPQDVAKWMMEELKRVIYMDQNTVVYQIKDRFGDKFTYTNNNGNLAIDKKVLDAFRKISGDKVIWERGTRMWRFREKYDDPGRQQQG
jgi:hypothetical protein